MERQLYEERAIVDDANRIVGWLFVPLSPGLPCNALRYLAGAGESRSNFDTQAEALAWIAEVVKE